MSRPALISGDMFERLARDHQLDIEADADFKYITHRGVTFRARLETVGGAR